VKKGDTVGIIGENGAGKSTLLKIIYNIVTPTSGNIVVNGNVSALLEIGSGFNPEFTGIENIYFNGTIMGFSKEDMDKKVDDILSFADIGEFVYQPVKTYSTGMFMRLAFSVATCIDPEILIIDEALSVGDMFFQAKCIDKMKNMIDENNVTLLFVSHNTSSVKSICKKGLFLNKGKLIKYGNATDVVEHYYFIKVKNQQEIINKNTDNVSEKDADNKKYSMVNDNALFQKAATYQRIQNGKAMFTNVQLLNEKEEVIHEVNYDQIVILRMFIKIDEDIHILDHGYEIWNEQGVEIVHSDSIIENKTFHDAKKGERFIIDWKFKASIMAGKYSILCALIIPINYEKVLVEYCDYVPIAVQFCMAFRPVFPLIGIIHLDNKVDIVKYG
jgi:lipopolysaccharide transport system ATP-binding protein